jgi:hypothetical protein
MHLDCPSSVFGGKPLAVRLQFSGVSIHNSYKNSRLESFKEIFGVDHGAETNENEFCCRFKGLTALVAGEDAG